MIQNSVVLISNGRKDLKFDAKDCGDLDETTPSRTPEACLEAKTHLLLHQGPLKIKIAMAGVEVLCLKQLGLASINDCVPSWTAPSCDVHNGHLRWISIPTSVLFKAIRRGWVQVDDWMGKDRVSKNDITT